ncbi:sentrin-specific protease 8 [Amyelois transitella]|uniref:sentrin-specific protease 8 n=1 Tax=Amyelois transitella TaxID=680683 RepID=UPI00298FCF8E|nr:sentrin-specific protease 8 [Amyelois transitella]
MVQTDEIKMFLEPLHIHRKNFIFFALNDNDSPDRAGGSHWSLLVYSKPESCFFHLDSSSGTNHNVAWEFASHLIAYFSKESINFVDKECLQQSNGYDCGVHVICNTERLAECVQAEKHIGSCDMLVKVNPVTKRREILTIIGNLSASS